MIKATFFDIDGTLWPFGCKELPVSTRNALTRLQEKGIYVFVATGRCVSHLNVLLEKIRFPFDGFVTLNGQNCYNHTETVWTSAYDRKDIEGVLKFHEAHPGAVWCVDELKKRHYNSIYTGEIKDLDRNVPPLADVLREILAEGRDLIQVSATLDQELEKEILSHMPGCKSVRWHPEHADIIPQSGGKCVGIAKMLAHYGLTFEHAMAFGDGGNDISMIEASKIGVAMGNASDAVKQHADYVTTDADQDGIWNALEHFGLL